MKNLIYIFYIFLLSSCFPTNRNEDSLYHRIYISNNSDKPIYIYVNFGYFDSLPLLPSLMYLDYIDANAKSTSNVISTVENQQLQGDDNKLTYFFISKEMLRDNTLEELHRKQLYVKKVTLTQEQLKAMNWEYSYNP